MGRLGSFTVHGREHVTCLGLGEGRSLAASGRCDSALVARAEELDGDLLLDDGAAFGADCPGIMSGWPTDATGTRHRRSERRAGRAIGSWTRSWSAGSTGCAGDARRGR